MGWSLTKNFCSASRPQIARALAHELRDLRVKVALRVTDAGTALARLEAFRTRKNSFRRLRYVGVNTARLLRTGGIAALWYGQTVVGVTKNALLAQRKAAAACLVKQLLAMATWI